MKFTINERRVKELALARLSNEKQRAACALQLEAALLKGTRADVVHLQQHAHNLLQADMDLQKLLAEETKKIFT